MYMVICTLNISSSEITRLTKTKIRKCNGRMNIYINDLGHMTKMVVRAVNSKIHLKSSSPKAEGLWICYLV